MQYLGSVWKNIKEISDVYYDRTEIQKINLIFFHNLWIESQLKTFRAQSFQSVSIRTVCRISLSLCKRMHRMKLAVS